MLVDLTVKAVIVAPEERTLAKNTLERKLEQMKPSKPEPASWNMCYTKLISLLSDFDGLASSATVSTTVSEIERYLIMATIPRNDDPLKWWKEQCCSMFLNIYKVTMYYLGNPATGTASEHVFSSARNIVGPKRMSLTSEHVEELVFLHENEDI
ncbi:hypothetical protein PR048_014262 [Dryococelus australis]|uniref:HAT C-terminal dimerisation domain-containing protein n=1 Tax=Dryococelus australis TaxID=614101 RepID=A0ABQ9HDW5_9NEOP|nr:hypothetical protein PR048_014262 [Dryococelus australis]